MKTRDGLFLALDSRLLSLDLFRFASQSLGKPYFSFVICRKMIRKCVAVRNATAVARLRVFQDESREIMARWQELIADFQDLAADERVEELVELADELPDVSPGRSISPPPESCRVQECQTPVYLWVDVCDGRVKVEAYVSRHSPTVRGLVALLVDAVNGLESREVLSLPENLLEQLGLAESLGMTRQHGFQGVIRRIKREVQAAQAPA